jgi:uncharacterized membrane protein
MGHNMNIFLIVWGILVGLVLIASIIFAGYAHNSAHEREDFVFQSVVLAVLLPIVIAVAPIYGILYLPYYLLIKLGERLRTRRNQ